MSRSASLAALLLVVAISPWPFVVAEDKAGGAAEKEAEGTTPRRIRLDRAVEDSIQQRLLKRVTLKFDRRELQDVLSDLVKKADVPIAIDRATLTDEGVALDQPLSLDVEDITLRSALRLILHPLQLTTVVQDEILIVTTGVKAGEKLENRVYDVDTLLPRNDYTPLIEVVTSCVEPDSWDEVGGPCSVRELNRTRSLVVRATQPVHESIASVFADLEFAIYPEERKPAVNTIRERELAIGRKLVESCSVHCDGVPIERVLSEFAATHKLPLWTDRTTLADEGIDYNQAVTAHLKDVRIETALNHLLRPFDLTWIVEDEVLKVTSRVKAGERLVAKVYDVRDLATKIEPTWPPRQEQTGALGGGPMGTGGGYFSVRPAILKQGFGSGGQPPAHGTGGALPEPRWLSSGYDLTELIESVTSTIEPDTWDQVGGAGSIREFQHALVIRQTGEVHSQVEILLHNLRTVLRRHAQQQAAKPEDPQEPKRVVYDFVAPYEYSPDDLAKLIPESIAPATWKNAGGSATLHVQPSRLVITQTPAVHKEIVKLLYEVVLQQRVE